MIELSGEHEHGDQDGFTEYVLHQWCRHWSASDGKSRTLD